MEGKEDPISKATNSQSTDDDGGTMPKDLKLLPGEPEKQSDFRMNEQVKLKLAFGGETAVEVHGDKEESERGETGKEKMDDSKNEPSKEKQREEVKNDNLKTIEHTKSELDETKEDNESTTIKNKFVDIDLENTTNNNTTNNSDRKEDIKRTRFSSEVKILPKPYFHAGAETVVTLPPASSQDVIVNEMNSSLQPVVLNATPSEYKSNPDIPSFLPLTIFSCLFCCPMIGLFAVYKSLSVRKQIERGNIAKARQSSDQARQLGILTMIIGFLFVLAIVTIAIMVSAIS